jgi:predicted DNA-binding ribbon-helix-helix protein
MFRGVRIFTQPLFHMAQAQIDAAKQAEQLASGTVPPKKQRKPDAIRDELKPKAPVQLVNGKRVFLSQLSGKPTERRFGVPVFNKAKELKRVLGCFASFQEVFDYLHAKRKADAIDQKRYDALVTDVTNYIQAGAEQLAAEGSLGVFAETVAEKKAPKAAAEPKKEKKPKAAQPVAAAAPKSAASGGKYVIIPGDVNMEDVDAEKAQKAPSLHEALLQPEGNLVRRVEFIYVPSEGVVLMKRLEAPGASTLKIIARASGVTAESLNLDPKTARDSKYSVVIRAAKLKQLSKEKQKKAAAKQKSETKQKKVKAARDVQPLPIAV